MPGSPRIKKMSLLSTESKTIMRSINIQKYVAVLYLQPAEIISSFSFEIHVLFSLRWHLRGFCIVVLQEIRGFNVRLMLPYGGLLGQMCQTS